MCFRCGAATHATGWEFNTFSACFSEGNFVAPDSQSWIKFGEGIRPFIGAFNRVLDFRYVALFRN